MPLENPDQLHLRAAHGYIELGMFDAANAELEEIDPFCRHLPEMLMARLGIYHGLEKWELLAVIAKKLSEWNPKEPGYFVEFAYATRRFESIHAAHAILTRASALHPTEGTIQFNLLVTKRRWTISIGAKEHLKRATEIDAKFKLLEAIQQGSGEYSIGAFGVRRIILAFHHARLVSLETFIGVPMLSSRATKLKGTHVFVRTSFAISTLRGSLLGNMPISSDASPASRNRCAMILRAAHCLCSWISAP